MKHRVGRITVAAALILIGALLIADNLFHTSISWYVAHLWPALLIILGLEWLAVASRLPEGEPVRVDGGAVGMLVIVAVVAMAFSAVWDSPLRRDRVVISLPGVPSLPSLPSLPSPSFPIPQMPSIEPSASYTADTLEVSSPEGIKDLLVVGGAGDITVHPGTRLEVRLKVKAFGWDDREAQANARRVRLQVTPGPTTQVQALVPPDLRQVELAFDVTVPATVNLRLESVSGNVKVDGQEANVTAQSTSGELWVGGVKGNVDLRTSSGRATVNRVAGDVTVTSSSGQVEVSDVAGIVKASSTSGGVNLSLISGPVVAQVSSGSLKVDATQVGGNYDLTAVSGPIQLTLPKDAPVSVTARSSSGSVSGPAWLTIGEGRNSGTGVNGAGTYKVTATTTSGGIVITGR